MYKTHIADQDDMDMLLTQFAVAGADDVMLNYQSTSFHDALYLRQVLGLRPAPEFEQWQQQHGIFNAENQLQQRPDVPALFKPFLQNLSK